MIRTRHPSTKSHGSSVRTKPGGSSRHSSGRSAAMKKGRNGSIISLAGHGLPEESNQHQKPKAVHIETIKFIYSEAVARAFKRKYKAREFGPPSAAPRKCEQPVEVTKLPELYSEFKTISRLIESNQRHIEELRRQAVIEDSHGSDSEGQLNKRNVKLPRLTHRNTQHTKLRHRKSKTSDSEDRETASNVPKFPPIV